MYDLLRGGDRLVALREMLFLIYYNRCKNPKTVAVGGQEWDLN